MHECFSDSHGLIRAFVANKRHTQFVYFNLMLRGELPRMHECCSDSHGLIRAFVAITPSAQTLHQAVE